jgi:hypothetical protein
MGLAVTGDIAGTGPAGYFAMPVSTVLKYKYGLEEVKEDEEDDESCHCQSEIKSRPKIPKTRRT